MTRDLNDPDQIKMPEWMNEKCTIKEEDKNQKGTGFIRKTLSNISETIMYEFAGESHAAKKGMLQHIDPRVKLLFILFFMLYAGITSKFIILSLLAAIAVMMVIMSKLEFIPYVKRVWAFIPLIMLVLSLPAATNLIIKGDAVVYIYRDIDLGIGKFRFPEELYFTFQGINTVLRTALRVGTSISFGYLLVMTTRWSHITKALAALRVPKIVISILDMTYRYIFVLCSTVIQMYEARYLRTVGNLSNHENRRFVANSIGFLFIKVNHLSEGIYDSMVCRGYAGEPVSLKEFKLSMNDFIWIANNMIIVIILLIGSFVFE